MNEVIAKIQTWGCGECGYNQNFDPSDAQLWNLHINQDATITTKRGLVPQGCCPACYTGMNRERIQRDNCTLDAVVDLANLTTTTSASDTELEERQVEELDANGQPIMIQTGSRWELSVDQSTGKVGSVEVPVYEPKMRSLTTQELAELKEQRDRNLDSLESVAVKEVN